MFVRYFEDWEKNLEILHVSWQTKPMNYAKNSENQKNIVGEGTYTVKNVARGKCAAFIKANHLY